MHCTPPDSDTSLAFPARPEHTCRYSRSCSYCCSLPSTLLPKQNTSTSQNLCSLPLIRELQGMVDSPMCRSDTQTVDCHIWSACMHRAPCRASTTGCYRKLADSTSNSEEIGGTRHIQCTLSPGQSGLVLLLRISQCAQADQRWPRPEPRATAGRHCACLFAGTR
jgi:hypothetical protein